MDKRREPLTHFRWRKDAAGYDLSGDVIRRRGGKLIEYDPSIAAPPLHRVFAGLTTRTRQWRELSEAIGEKPSRTAAEFSDPSQPFHLREFENDRAAVLAFVNEYGFLGSDRAGADQEQEAISWVLGLVGQLRELGTWGTLHRPGNEGILAFHRYVGEEALTDPAMAGPMLRMIVLQNPRSGAVQVQYEPESLYAWMWLQTADDLTSGVDWSGAPCLLCHQPIGRGPGGHRRDAKFCCDKHRTYFYRLPDAEQRRLTKEARALSRKKK